MGRQRRTTTRARRIRAKKKIQFQFTSPISSEALNAPDFDTEFRKANPRYTTPDREQPEINPEVLPHTLTPLKRRRKSIMTTRNIAEDPEIIDNEPVRKLPSRSLKTRRNVADQQKPNFSIPIFYGADDVSVVDESTTDGRTSTKAFQSTCFICRKNVIPSRSTKSTSELFSAWAESCAESLRQLFKLDESFKRMLVSAVYCHSCSSVVRDIHFVVKSINSLQCRLRSARDKVESLIRTNYVKVVQETSDLDPLDDSILSPSDIFIKAVGGALGFEIGTEPDVDVKYFSVNETFLSTTQTSSRTRSARRLESESSVILPDENEIEDYAHSDSDSKASGNSGIDPDPDFDPGPDEFCYEDSVEDYPIQAKVKRDSGRLKALISRQRELRNTRNVLAQSRSHTSNSATPRPRRASSLRQKKTRTHDESNPSKRQPIKCEYDGCRFTARTRSGHGVHRNITHGEDPDTPYHCENAGCGKRFGTQYYLSMHLRRGLCLAGQNQAAGQEQLTKDAVIDDWGTSDPTINTESVDPDTRAQERRLVQRLKNEAIFMNRKKLKCDALGCKFITFEQLRLDAHVKKKHYQESEPYSCNFCGMKFSKLLMLRKHNQKCPVPVKNTVKRHWKKRKRKSKAAFRPNPCEICSKSFETEAEMKAHLELHREREAVNVNLTFSCVMPQCDKWFVNSKELRAHVLQDHEDTKFKCTVCGLVLITAQQLKQHMIKRHTEPDPSRKCPEPGCPYVANTKWNLKIHYRAKHTGAKDFQCAICGKSFVWSKSLLVHTRVHENYRPYKCHFANCNKTFTMSDRLRVHEETHSTLRSFHCSLCQKSYKTTKDLQQHLRLTHKLHENLKQYFIHMNLVNEAVLEDSSTISAAGET